MFLLVVFVEVLFEMVVRQRAAIYSMNRRLTLQSHALARLNYRLRLMEREQRRATTQN